MRKSCGRERTSRAEKNVCDARQAVARMSRNGRRRREKEAITSRPSAAKKAVASKARQNEAAGSGAN